MTKDFATLCGVRADAERLGMPLIVWSYARGSAVAAKVLEKHGAAQVPHRRISLTAMS